MDNTFQSARPGRLRVSAAITDDAPCFLWHYLQLVPRAAAIAMIDLCSREIKKEKEEESTQARLKGKER